MAEQPLIISAIGTPQLHDGTGEGGVGEATGTRAGKTVMVETPAGQRDVQVNLIRPSVAILIRALWLFVTTLSGMLGADAIPGIPVDLTFMQKVILAGSAVGMNALKDAGVILNSLKDKYPLLTGGI